MKKILTLAVLMLVASASFAQLAVGVGYINPKQTVKYNNNSYTNALNGFQLGADYTLNFGEVGLTPGIHFTFATGTNENNIGTLVSTKSTQTETYVAIPVHLSYSYDLARDMRVFVYAGPTFNCGLSSKMKYDASGFGASGTITTDLYNDSDDYAKFEVLLGGGVGFDLMETFRFSLGWDYGLTNRYTGTLDGYKQHSSMVNFTISYLL